MQISRYDLLRYKLSFSKEKNPHICWAKSLYLVLFFLKRLIQSKNGHNHQALNS